MGPELRRLDATRQFISSTDVVGLSLERLVSIAGEQQIEVRVIAGDGAPQVVPDDLRLNRINVEVTRDFVTRVEGVY